MLTTKAAVSSCSESAILKIREDSQENICSGVLFGQKALDFPGNFIQRFRAAIPF